MSEASYSEGRSHYYALEPGSRLFEFEIVSVLGHGGFGITYLAQDSLLQEKVALKEFFPSDAAVRVRDATVRAKSDPNQPRFEEGLKSFLDEVRLITGLRHRNFAHVRRFFELHGTGYIAQDYESGQTLGGRLNDGPLDEPELRTLLAGVLDGLEAIHERSTLHGDLNPDNVIIRDDGSPVLINFGVARDFYSSDTRNFAIVGGCAPPEYFGGEQGPGSDLYALGAIAYRCVTGAPPPISLQRLRRDPLVPAAQAAKGRYAPDLLDAIDWMLAIDEDKRPPSVAAARQALRGA